MNKPYSNIIYLHAHDAGRFVSPYGYAVPTPHLMRFAQEATLFRKAFCTAPTCGPSRSSLLSGQYPHEVGVYGMPRTGGWRYDDYGKHLAANLNQAGYETALAGCQHEIGKTDEELYELGYQRLLNTRSPKGIFYPETIDLVEKYLAENHEKPFFLSIGTDEPHRNNIPREELGIGGESSIFSKTRYYKAEALDSRYTAPPPWLPDIPGIRQDMASYCYGVKIMDEYMGRVLEAVDQFGYRDNTLVIVTTDHGIEFPGGKKTLRDSGLGVMLMIRGPGLPAGHVLEPMVSQLDIYPTICAYTGIGDRPWLSGKNLLPLMSGEVDSLHDSLFAEQTYHGKLEPMRSIRTERYKYVRRFYPTGPRMRQDGPSTAIMESCGFYDRTTGEEELYDLYLDPTEACNLIGNPDVSEIRDTLSARLDAWMTQTNDAFASGEFPPEPS